MSSKPLNNVEPTIGTSAHDLKCTLLILAEQAIQILIERRTYGRIVYADQFISELSKIRAQCSSSAEFQSFADVYDISRNFGVIARRMGIVLRNTEIEEDGLNGGCCDLYWSEAR